MADDVFDLTRVTHSPLHRDLAAIMAEQRWQDWPSVTQLNALLSSAWRSVDEPRRRICSDATAGIDGAAAYERHIFQTGQIPLRPRHWHDLFNALMWISFPATKTALNVVHNRELAAPGAQRSARRDALTLFDECGVVLASSGPRFQRRHAAHDWHSLFVERRDAWDDELVPLIVGHGLYEQCLTPYVGLTAKALYVPLPAGWTGRSTAAGRAAIDQVLARDIVEDRILLNTAELLPLPVLGVPRWWPPNEDPAFYANASYFRPKRVAPTG